MSDILNELSTIIQRRDTPDPELIKKHNIKLGLRNEDGSGVIVGLTGKGSVISYTKDAAGRKTDAEGELYYCGISIQDLAGAHRTGFGYEETAFLLLTGSLPTHPQLARFTEYMATRRGLPVRFRNDLSSIVNNNMMNSLQIAVSNLYGEDPAPDSTAIKDVTRHSIDLIAKFPSLVAYAYHSMQFKYKGQSLTLMNPATTGSLAENFLHMFRAGRGFTPEEARLLDLFLILHAEHGGGNNSTFTVRTVSSSETDTFSAITAGLTSLKGHLHGGANEKVMSMFAEIKTQVKDWRDRDEVSAYLWRVFRKEVGDRTGKLYGIGHAVYTLSDPRAVLLKEVTRKLAATQNRMEEFDLLAMIGDLGPRIVEEGKPGKKVAPNVDFYSGFMLDCMNIPVEIYTPLFAMARVSGWCAHRLEQLVQNRLIRPAYLNSTPKRAYVPIEQRTQAV
jgi:citrate synthase